MKDEQHRKSEQLIFRVTQSEKETIARFADRRRSTVSDVVRDFTLRGIGQLYAEMKAVGVDIFEEPA